MKVDLLFNAFPRFFGVVGISPILLLLFLLGVAGSLSIENKVEAEREDGELRGGEEIERGDRIYDGMGGVRFTVERLRTYPKFLRNLLHPI